MFPGVDRSEGGSQGLYQIESTSETAFPQYLQDESFQRMVSPHCLHIRKWPLISCFGFSKCRTIRKNGNTQSSPHSSGFLPREIASLNPMAAGSPKISSIKIISFIRYPAVPELYFSPVTTKHSKLPNRSYCQWPSISFKKAAAAGDSSLPSRRAA